MFATRLIWLVLIIALLHCGDALYFLVHEERKCYSLEQPRNTPAVFNYEILDTDEVVMFDLYYGKKANKESVIFHKTLRDASGHIDFVTDNEGYYLLCVQQASPRTPGGGGKGSKKQHAQKASKEAEVTAEVMRHPTRFRLAIRYGYDSEYYEKLGKKENFDTVNLDVRRLNDMLDMTLNEADYQKHKEVEYHSETESMNTAALWWPMLQIGILVLMGIFQVSHLKSFFKSNKLI
jgi:hypothetical protein